MTVTRPDALARVRNRPVSRRTVALASLLRADLFAQWRQRRALVLNNLAPLAFVIAWKSLIPLIGGPAVLATCIAVGLPATGLMGYSASVARDRERGVFQRLRAAPVPTWIIMASRLIVQIAVILSMTVSTCVFAKAFDGITLGAEQVALVLLAALIGGAAFLGLGQLVVAMLRSSEAVGASVRLIYVVIAVVGGIGATGAFGPTVQTTVAWSPLGTSRTLLAAAMSSTAGSTHAVVALAATLAYAVVFTAAGIRWFKWTLD